MGSEGEMQPAAHEELGKRDASIAGGVRDCGYHTEAPWVAGSWSSPTTWRQQHEAIHAREKKITERGKQGRRGTKDAETVKLLHVEFTFPRQGGHQKMQPNAKVRQRKKNEMTSSETDRKTTTAKRTREDNQPRKTSDTKEIHIKP